jgi:hypothetical protein
VSVEDRSPFCITSCKNNGEVVPGVVVNVSVFVGEEKFVDKDVWPGFDCVECIYFFLKT